VIGAGQVGTAVVAALHHEHDVTVLELDPVRLSAISYRFDVLPVQGSGTARADLLRAGARATDLVIAATDRDETNIVAAMLIRAICDGRIVVRTRSAEYYEAWRAGHLDVDFIVSSEQETAQAVARAIGYPNAVQTDVFAEGRVEMVEFAIDGDRDGTLAGRTLAEAEIPAESVVASIIRPDHVIIPRGDDRIEAGDRLVLIASPAAAREWARRLSPTGRSIGEVVIFGGGDTGAGIAGLLAELRLRVRVIERSEHRARLIADQLKGVRVFHADGTDGAFLEREAIGRADAAICCTDDDGTDLLLAMMARRIGIPTVLAVVGNPEFIPLFLDAGVSLALNERQVTAEEIVRFTHDPRTRAFAMLENDRVEVLELDVRPGSTLLGRRFAERPLEGAIVGAIVRGDRVVFPRGNDSLEAGDRAILVADARSVRRLESAL
jgi:trk system potassium uptake protein TrkA